MGDYGRVRVRREIIEAAPERCHRAWIELEDVLRDTVADLRGQAARKRLALRLSMPPDLPVVRGDAEQLLEFFTALFSAAIENTPQNGRVSLDIERGQGCAILLSIADSGNGLPRKEIEAAAGLFAPFGSLEVDGATGPAPRVPLPRPTERWRAHPREFSSGGALQPRRLHKIQNCKGAGTPISLPCPPKRREPCPAANVSCTSSVPHAVASYGVLDIAPDAKGIVLTVIY